MQYQVTFGKNSQRIYNTETNRSEDDSRFLTITDCVLTAEAVNDYSGNQLADSDIEKFGLDRNAIYAIYRPLEEIEKARDTYNLRPMTDDHVAITPEAPRGDVILGASGESAYIVDGQLLNTIIVWSGKGQQYIEDADNNKESGKKDLSCGYAYDLVKEEGEFNGKKYQFKMVNLRCNHVALVKFGRVDEAMIADSDNNLNEGVQVVKKKSPVRMILDHFLGDAKGKDNEEKLKDNENLMRKMKEIAGKDASEFEGGEAEKGKTLMEMASSLHDMEDPKCSDEDEPKEKTKADDEEESISQQTVKKVKKENEQAAEDEEESEPKTKDKPKAEDSADLDAIIAKRVDDALKARLETINLCESVVGKLSNELAMDSDLENIVNQTLRLKGQEYQGKSLDNKLSMLQVLKSQTRPSHYVGDSKSTSKTPAVSIFNAMKGK